MVCQEVAPGLSSSPIEPPASLVLLGTIPPGVVVVVPVVRAELRPLVAGPTGHAHLVVARQRVSGRARVGSEGQQVVALQKSIGSKSKCSLHGNEYEHIEASETQVYLTSSTSYHQTTARPF